MAAPHRVSETPLISMRSFSWRKPDSWPSDTPDYVFLARAFNQVGTAKYGAKWLRETPEPRGDPDDNDAEEDDSVEGLNAWSEAHDQWEKNYEEYETELAEMRKKVRREIAELCLAGILLTGVRPKGKVRIVEVPTKWWDIENFDRRFETCKLSQEYPFATELIGLGGWIFVKRTSLTEYSKSLLHSRPLRSRIENRSGCKGAP
jgi:hypothetical protein